MKTFWLPMVFAAALGLAQAAAAQVQGVPPDPNGPAMHRPTGVVRGIPRPVGVRGIVIGRPVIGRPVIGRPIIGRPVIGRPVLGRKIIGRPVIGKVIGRPIYRNGRPYYPNRPIGVVVRPGQGFPNGIPVDQRGGVEQH